MGVTLGLKGLGARDRTPEDQREISEINAMVGDSISSTTIPPTTSTSTSLEGFEGFEDWEVFDPSDLGDFDERYLGITIDTAFGDANSPANRAFFENIARELEAKRAKKEQDELYNEHIEDIRKQTRSGLPIENKYTQEIKDIAYRVSPYYKKYKYSDKITLTTAEWNELAAQYAGMCNVYGQEYANQQLNQSIKDNVASNQTILEKGWNALAGMGADAAGSAVSTAGLLWGLGKAIVGDYEYNPNLNAAENFFNTVLDNEVTRYGSDVVKYGTILNLNEAKELGISQTEIMNTAAQDQQFLTWNTPFEVVQNGGFTATSMFTGAAMSKVSDLAFRGMKKGALSRASSLTKAKQTITRLQKIENVNNKMIPGLTGTVEGVIEGLDVKINLEESGYKDAYAAHNKAVEEETLRRLKANYLEVRKNPEEQPKYYDKDGNEVDVSAVYAQVQEEMQPQLEASLANVEAMATKAGIGNFFVNSAINGLINSTYKAGLQSESVQNSLRKGKLTGWAMPKEELKVTGTFGNAKVKPSISTLGKAWLYIKEPLGNFKEEYLQSVSSDFFTGFAENNIHNFIDYKYNGGVERAIGESYAEDWAAAWTEAKHSLTSKETLKAGVYGALSSVGGTVSLSKRTNKLDENGNVVLKRDKQGNLIYDRNGKPVAEKTFFGRGQSADGDRETRWESLSRWVPWRSGLTANIRAVNERLDAEKVQAQALEDWLNDPKNKDKFDGLVGSLSWMQAMEESAARGDEHGYKSSKLGKTVNDIFMLQKMEGSELYNSIMRQLVDVAYMERDSEAAKQYIQSIKDNVNTRDESKSDDEIFNELKGNAKSMLDLMAKVREESKSIEKLIGNVDDDVKQSLIYGQLSLEHLEKESKELDEALKGIKVENSTVSSTNLTEKQKSIISQYGSLENARKERERLTTKLSEMKSDINSILKREGAISKQEIAKLAALKAASKQVANELQGLEELDNVAEDATTTLNEEEIMALNPIERAQLILRAKEKMYRALHRTAEEKDITSEDVAEDNPNGITEAQRKVIDNLVEKGTAVDRDFLDKIVNAGRVEHAKNKFLKQYNEVLISPQGLMSYAARAKQQAADELTKEKTKKLGEIKDYAEFSAALGNALEKASRYEEAIIRRTLKDNENYKKYADQESTIKRIVNTMSKSEKFKDLDANTADLVMQTTAFLYDSGVNLKDEDAVWNAITAQNDEGYNNLVSYINQLNEGRPVAEQTKFTSLEEVFQTYKDVIKQVKDDIATQERLKEPIKTNPETKQDNPTPPPTPKIEEEKKEEKKEDDNPNADFQSMTTPKGLTVSVGDKVSVDWNGMHHGGTVTRFDKQGDKDVVVYSDEETGKERYWFLHDFDEGGDAKVVSKAPKKAGIFGTSMVSKSAEEAGESLKREKKEETSLPASPLEQAKKDEGKHLPPKQAAPKQQEKREVNPNAVQVETLSIDQIRKENPESASVKFYDKHHIRQFLTSGKINGDTDVFFLVDPMFTQEVMDETESYNNETDLPLIAVVEDENGQYEINGKKYQPIGVIPSSRGNLSGSARMAEVRKNANTKERSLVTIDGQLLRTKPVAGGIKADQVDNNVRENQSLQDLLSLEMTPTEKEEFDSLNKRDRKSLQSYAREKKSFLARMFTGVDEKTGKKKIFFRQPKGKDKSGEETNTINIFVKPIDKTTGSNNNNTLLDAINQGAIAGITQFNSRTKGITRKVKDFLDGFPTPEEAMTNPVTPERLNGFAEGLQANLSRYLYLTNSNTAEKWHYTIEYAPEEVSEARGEATFILSVTNGENTIQLTTFSKSINTEEIAADIIRNLVSENGNWKMIDENPLARWQVDYGDVEAMHKGNRQAQLNISELVDDGIFEMSATSLSYANPKAIIEAPFMEKEGKTVQRYPIQTNPDNATDTSSKGDSQASTNSGAVVDADSGAVISGTPTNPTTHSAEWAKEKADEIVKGSEMFKLSDDERSYINTKTGRTHARVTSVISADERGSRFDDTSGWRLSSTLIGNTIDDIVRGFFEGDFYWLGPHLCTRKSRSEADENFLERYYPNISEKDLTKFVKQLEGFKAMLDSQGIHIVPRNVVASGTIEVTDSKGEKHSIEVAGTLDLLGYDDAGNFYIFDMKTVRDPSSLQGKKHKWSMQTSLYQKFLENTYGITVKQRFIIPIHVHYDSPTKVKYEKGEGNQLIADGKEYRGTMPNLMKVTAVEYQEPKINYDKLSEEERDMAQEISQIAKDGGTITGEEMKEEPVKAEVSDPMVPKTDPTIGLPVGDMNDITSGLFSDSIDDNVLLDNDGSTNTPVPGKTRWSTMSKAQQDVMTRAGWTEESWNAVDNAAEAEHSNDCLG